MSDNDWVIDEDDTDVVDVVELVANQRNIPPLESDDDTANDFGLIPPRRHCLDLPASNLPLIPDADHGDITVRQSRVVLVAAAQRHNLSLAALQTNLNIISLFLPTHVHFEKNITKIKQSLGYDESLIDQHFYCKSCYELLPDGAEVCNCGSRDKTYFVVMNLQQQLEIIMNYPGMWDRIKAHRREILDGKIRDITDAKVYRKLREAGGFLCDKDVCNLTLTLSEDAVKVYRTPKCDIDVVSCIINDIPPSERTKRRNLLLFGVWQSREKVHMNTFTKPIVEELERLYKPDGGKIITIDGKVMRVRLKVIQLTMDLMARAPFCGMTTHRGDCPCATCEDIGEMILCIKKMTGTTRTFEPDEPNRCTRTVDSIQMHAHTAQIWRERQHTQLNSCGFTSYAPILGLSYFHPDMIGYDPLHMIWLNILKNNYDYIFQTDIIFPVARVRAEMRRRVDEIVLPIKPTNGVSRLPRSIKHVPGFKGSEMKFLGLYALPVAFRDVLPPELYDHFLSLMEAVWLLSREEIGQADLNRADQLITDYVKDYSTRYGRPIDDGTEDGDTLPAATSINVHNLEHLVNNVVNFGPLDCSDCAPFETNYGMIIKGLHSTRGVMQGAIWNDYSHKLCAQETLRAEGDVKLVLCSLTRQMAYVTSLKTDTCHVLGNLKSLTADQTELLTLIGRQDLHKYAVASKIIRNRCYMDSVLAEKQIKRRNSHCVILKDNTRGIRYAHILYYLVNAEQLKVECVFFEMKFEDYLHPTLCHYIISVQEQQDEVVTNVRFMIRPAIRINAHDKIYLALPPKDIKKE